MRTGLFVVIAATVFCLGSGEAQSIDAGRGELAVRGPADRGASPLPLVVLLHGYTSTGAEADEYLGLSRLADRYGFLLVAPDGSREPGRGRETFWNASPACCDFLNTEIDDSAYVLDIINTTKSRYDVDSDRVYLVGHSNGGFLAFRAAYDHSDAIAAIASLAGATHLEERSAPASPVHILAIHGTDDAAIAYDGGEVPPDVVADSVLKGNRYPSALESVERWASYNGCRREGVPRERRDLDKNLPGHESDVLTFRQGCQRGGSSELWTINGGAHVPDLSETFGQQVIEWLLAHPRTN